MNNNIPSQPSFLPSALLALALVVLGVCSRVLLANWPNFNMAIAIAIFIGYAIKDKRIAIPAILIMMGISDWLIGFYDWRVMLSVYSGFVIAWATGWAFQNWIDSSRIGIKFAGILIPAVVSATAFFVITNAACCVAGWYPMTWSGLMTSFSAGLPFFRSTLASSVCFSLLIFGCYFAARQYLAISAASITPRRPIQSD